jgi:hypothetical protein
LPSGHAHPAPCACRPKHAVACACGRGCVACRRAGCTATWASPETPTREPAPAAAAAAPLRRCSRMRSSACRRASCAHRGRAPVPPCAARTAAYCRGRYVELGTPKEKLAAKVRPSPWEGEEGGGGGARCSHEAAKAGVGRRWGRREARACRRSKGTN